MMRNIIKILDKDGYFVSESHYLVSLIKTVQYDTIYHEHMRYYSLMSLKYLFDKYNLKIFHAKKIPTHGGSIRVYVSKNKKIKETQNLKKVIKDEKKFFKANTFSEFSRKVLLSKINLYSLLKKIKSKDKTIFGVGAHLGRNIS